MGVPMACIFIEFTKQFDLSRFLNQAKKPHIKNISLRLSQLYFFEKDFKIRN